MDTSVRISVFSLCLGRTSPRMEGEEYTERAEYSAAGCVGFLSQYISWVTLSLTMFVVTVVHCVYSRERGCRGRRQADVLGLDTRRLLRVL